MSDVFYGITAYSWSELMRHCHDDKQRYMDSNKVVAALDGAVMERDLLHERYLEQIRQRDKILRDLLDMHQRTAGIWGMGHCPCKICRDARKLFDMKEPQ